MQIYAYTPSRELIHAHAAARQRDYSCIECGASVRLRGGSFKQLHFYHVSPSGVCHLSGKSESHLHAQYALQKLLAPEETLLEHPFKKINRIADVVYPPKKLIFEIQCSPISIREIAARHRDYESLGYQIIWIFHDKRYNHFRLSPAECFLSNSSYFFTNIDASGEGIIYLQRAILSGGRRIFRKKPLPISKETLLNPYPSRRLTPLPPPRRPLPPLFKTLFHVVLEKITL